jgi:uncharacterized protein (TIGR03118 family)
MSFTRRAAAAALAASAFAALGLATPAIAAGQAYAVRHLVSNGVVDSDYFDPNMVNTWGVSFNPNGLVWVSNNRTGTSTLYDGLGAPNSLVVNVPAANGGVGAPTGIVFSGSADFVVSKDGKAGPSRFIFANEDGLITGWAPGVDLLNALPAVLQPNAIYMGLAVAQSPAGARLYATDYRNAKVDIYDSAFAPVKLAKAFVDPKLPLGMAPFGIQAMGSSIYVTFVKQGDYQPGSGMRPEGGGVDAVISVFDTDGRYLRRAVAKSGNLRQPWGIALAPADFGIHANRLLISDFHEGTIGAYDAATGAFMGLLRDRNGQALKVPGIWGMQFGNGLNNQPLNTLFFAAGPNGQGGGVYGSINVDR